MSAADLASAEGIHLKHRRAIVIILDSVGVGALPDAVDYGDCGANTLQHVAKACGGLKLPTMQSLGLGNIIDIEGVSAVDKPLAQIDKLATASAGKDTITGHWELMGLVSHETFPLYPQGFPPEVMNAFVELTGHGYLGNYPASGTEIIADLGPEHIASGKPIVYTSGDSVFQVAAHTDVIALDELYRICQIVRDDILVGKHACARVIARPFTGSVETGFVRTTDRHDYALSPPAQTALDRLQAAGIQTLCIGKISDIFNGRGVDITWSTRSNADGMEKLEVALDETLDTGGLIFANLVDFDMLWGHRRDCLSYGKGLEAFDEWLAAYLPKLASDDLLIITADHGCDPAHTGSDHTREYVPLMVYGPNLDRAAFDGLAPHTENHLQTQSHYLYKVATIIESYLIDKGA